MLAFLMADLQNFLENLFKFGLNVGPHNLTFALPVTLKFFVENLQVWVVSEKREGREREFKEERRKKERKKKERRKTWSEKGRTP